MAVRSLANGMVGGVSDFAKADPFGIIVHPPNLTSGRTSAAYMIGRVRRRAALAKGK